MLYYFVCKAYIRNPFREDGIEMSDKVSIKMPRRFLERYEDFGPFYGYRSFNNFCDHAVQMALEEHERRYEIHKFETAELKKHQQRVD